MDKRVPNRVPKESQEQPADPSRIERIAARAHELYERRGGSDGRDLDDWLEAEREIDGVTKE